MSEPLSVPFDLIFALTGVDFILDDQSKLRFE